MIRFALPLIALSTVACTPIEAQIPAAPATPCGAEKVSGLIGKKRTPSLERRVEALSGAARVRWIRPGMMVTMDYSETRLNVRVGPDGKILSVNCG
jgi:hypothetical protein